MIFVEGLDWVRFELDPALLRLSFLHFFMASFILKSGHDGQKSGHKMAKKRRENFIFAKMAKKVVTMATFILKLATRFS